MPETTNGNGGIGTWAKVPVTLLLAAIMALAAYAAKINYDTTVAQVKLTVAIERMDTRNTLCFNAVLANQLNIIAEMRAGRQIYNKTGKFGIDK